MAILNSLIVNGSMRCLNKIYVRDIDVSNNVKTSSLDVKGDIVGKNLYLGNDETSTVIYFNQKPFVSAINGLLTIDPIQEWSEGLYINSKYLKVNNISIDDVLKVDKSGFVSHVPVSIENSLIVDDDISSSSIISDRGIIDTLNVLGELRATKYTLDSTASLGGSFYVSPTLIFDVGNTTVNITAINSNDNTIQVRIINPQVINQDNAGGVVWRQYSKVKVYGKINNIPLGTVDAYLTSKMNDTVGALDLRISVPNIGDFQVANNVENSDIRIMIYEVGNGSVNKTLPVGILLTGYSTNNSSIIDIYNGEESRTKPRVRIGKLDDLDGSIKIGNIKPSGWGFYSDNAFLRGTIYSTTGYIGGWQIGENALINGIIGTDDSLFLYSSGDSLSADIANSGAVGDWRITAGSHFGVRKDGSLYSNLGKIGGWSISESAIYNGTDSMASSLSGLYLGTDGIKNFDSETQHYVSISNGSIIANDANISGTINANNGSIGNIHIGQNSIYSGNKTSIDSINDGFYIGANGSLNIGNKDEYIQYNGVNLDMQVNSLHIAGNRAATIDEIENLEVGGRNLIINTLNPSLIDLPKIAGSAVNTIIKGTPSVSTHGIKTTITDVGYPSFQFGTSSTNNANLQGLKAGLEYTLSFDCNFKLFSGTQSKENEYTLRVSVIYGNNNLNSNQRYNIHTFSKDDLTDRGTELTEKCKFTFNLPSDATMMYITIAPSTTANVLFGTGDYIEIDNIMLESGNFATDWNPAPEDVGLGILNSSKTASDFLHYDAKNGLVIYYVGNEDGENDYIDTGYYAQLTGNSLNFVAGGKIVGSYGTNVKFYYPDNGNQAISIDGSNGIQLYKTDGSTRSGILNGDGLVIETGRIGSVDDSKSWLIETGKISAKDDNDKYTGIAVKNYGYAFFAGGELANGEDSPFRVDHDGILYCSDGHFTGEVNATSGTIGGCRIVNGQLIISGNNISEDYKAEDDMIIGTQTNKTAIFVGDANFNELKDGKEISYWLPFDYSADDAFMYTPVGGTTTYGAALNLTLKNGSQTYQIPIFYDGLTRLTDQYNGGNVLKLTFRKNVKINDATVDKGFWCNVTYNHEFYDRSRWNGNIQASAPLTKGYICVGTSDGYKPLSGGMSFDITYPILFANEDVGKDNIGTEFYTQIPNVDLSITKLGFTGALNKTVYISGLLDGNTFITDSYVFTTTEPVIPDHRYYIPIGIMCTNTVCYFYWRGEIYSYYDGKFQNIGNGASSVITKWSYNGDTTYINGGNLYSKSVTADAINVLDLNAFNATIGGFHIGAESIYSGQKDSYQSKNNGIYLGKDGKLDIGSSGQYLRFDGENLNLKVKSLTIDGKDPAFQEDLFDISVGARNLLLNTKEIQENNNYPTATYQIGTLTPVVDETYTIQIKGTLDNKCTSWGVYNSGGRVRLAILTSENYHESTGTWSCSFKWVNKSGDNTVVPTYVSIYPQPNQQANRSTSKIEWVKLEKGSIPTDWTPAIEDISADIANASHTASNYLSFDDTNGLVISASGQLATGYNTQMTSNGIILRKDDIPLASYGTSMIMYRNIPSENYHQKALEVDSEGVRLYYKQLDSYQLGAELNASGLDVKAGKIGGWTIDSTSIYYGYKSGDGSNTAIISSADLNRTIASTWNRKDYRFIIGNDFGVTKDGYLYASNVRLKGYIEATGGTFSGTLSAANGTFSGKLSGVTGDFSGSVIATKGQIGGWAVNDHSLYSGELLLDTTGYFMLSTTDFSRRIGNVTRSGLRMAVGYNFGISNSGVLYASDAEIRGTIYATSGSFSGSVYANEGTIGGFNISTTSDPTKHCYASSLYTHKAFGDYNYEIGLTSDASDGSSEYGDSVFYVKSTKTGQNWNVAKDIFRVTDKGYIITDNAILNGGQIGGFIIKNGHLESVGGKIEISPTYYGGSSSSDKDERYSLKIESSYIGPTAITTYDVYANNVHTDLVGYVAPDFTSLDVDFYDAFMSFNGEDGSITFTCKKVNGLKVNWSDIQNRPDISSYATQTWVNNKSYATETWVNGKGYATETWVNNKGYATTEWVNNKSYATQAWVISGQFASETWVNQQGFLKSIPSTINVSKINPLSSTNPVITIGDFSSTNATITNITTSSLSGGFKTISIGDCKFTGAVNLGSSVKLGTSATDIPEGVATGGYDLYVGSQGVVKRRPSSSIRYKEIQKEMKYDDIKDYYNINVYYAKYKEGYSEDKNYMPMFIAENVYEHMPEAVSFNENGEIENWGYRVMIPAMFAMIKSQKEEIEKLKKEIQQIKKN